MRFKIARQEHLGEALGVLSDRGLVGAWVLDHDGPTAWWTIDGRRCTTKVAEGLVQGLCDEAGIRWMPVPAPGGERQLAEVRRLLEEH